jgi:Kef-type K+ transport system membrane component KefB
MGGSGGSIIDGAWAGSPFALFMVQVLIIISLSRTLGWVLKWVKMPQVVSEMLAGIIIGPTAFGRIPGFTDNVFPPASLNIIAVISNFALIFFLFIVGA